MLADTYFDGLSDDAANPVFLDVIKGVSNSVPSIANTIAVAKGLPPPYPSNQSGGTTQPQSYSSGVSARNKELLLLLGMGLGVFAVGYYFTKGKR